MVEISDENIVYFELYKKDKFLTKFESICSHKFVFLIAQNTMKYLPKLHTSIQNMCMYSKNKFYIFLKSKSIISDFFQKSRALILGCTKSALNALYSRCSTDCIYMKTRIWYGLFFLIIFILTQTVYKRKSRET
jgi:hypothetical protein